MNRELVAVDWGTSRVRAALISREARVLAEREGDDGILKVPPGGFEAVFERLCGDWMGDETRLCLMSGMVGSRNGWREAAYAPCPAGFAQLPGQLLWLQPSRHAIVPGLRCEHEGMPDVMRGEEVQAFGALALLGLERATLVLPGTHSKWCEVREGAVARFRTCMSGEFYALLREHSLLGRGVPESANTTAPDEEAFAQGLEQAQRSGSLLASAFSARSRVLMQQLAPAAVPDYLSGLVIGEELRAHRTFVAAGEPLVVIGAPALAGRYRTALQAQGHAVQCVGAEATWHGLVQIARQL